MSAGAGFAQGHSQEVTSLADRRQESRQLVRRGSRRNDRSADAMHAVTDRGGGAFLPQRLAHPYQRHEPMPQPAISGWDDRASQSFALQRTDPRLGPKRITVRTFHVWRHDILGNFLHLEQQGGHFLTVHISDSIRRPTGQTYSVYHAPAMCPALTSFQPRRRRTRRAGFSDGRSAKTKTPKPHKQNKKQKNPPHTHQTKRTPIN